MARFFQLLKVPFPSTAIVTTPPTPVDGSYWGGSYFGHRYFGVRFFGK